MLSLLLDIEWLLSTLFDASLLTFEPPETAALFLLVFRHVVGTMGGRPFRSSRFHGAGQRGERH